LGDATTAIALIAQSRHRKKSAASMSMLPRFITP
jgi:hypothetical protein